MVIESSQQPVKRGRGRPRKTPVAATQTHKEPAKRGRPPLAASKQSSLSWEEELAAFEKRSNKSGVLTMLVLLLGIALIGYGMYLKLHQAERIDEDMPINSQQPQTTQTSTGTNTGTKTPPAATTSNSIIQEYFTRINNGQFDTLSSLQDTSFRTLATLRNYFNVTRLQLFAKNTVGGIRVESLTENTTDAALKRNPTLSPKAYDFTLVYTLKSDEKEYRDQWRAYTIQKDNITVINWFVYEGTWISQSPFFQFSKFGIK